MVCDSYFECGCPEMESYEEFCLRSLTLLQERGGFKKMTCEPLWSLKACSFICFNGRAVLSPLLSAEQRLEMCELRQKTVQLEVNRENQQRNKLLARVQDILGQAQANNAPSEEVEKRPVSKSGCSSYTLVTDSAGPPRDPAFGLQANYQPGTPSSETPILNGYKAVEDVKVEGEEKSEEEDDISLDSLLKRPSEYMKKEHVQLRSKAVHAVRKTSQPETASDKGNRSGSPMRDTGVEFGFSLHHSPIGPPQTHIQGHTLYDPRPQQSGGLSPSLPERFARLPSPEFSIHSCPQRRRPRPFSTGNIHISFPIGPEDLIPQSHGRSREGDGMVEKGEALSGVTRLSDCWSPVGSEVDSRGGKFQSSTYGISPMQEAFSPVNASGCSPKGQHDHLTAGFRRRCHTLDDQLHSYHSEVENIDRSQERVPRLMSGGTWMTPSRRHPAALLNQSFELDNPSPSLRRPRITSDVDQVTLRMEPENPHRTNNGRVSSAIFRSGAEAKASQMEESQRRTQTLEDMQRCLKEEHAMQMSQLLAEQEKEQRHLCLELEEMERILKEQGFVQPLSGDACGWTVSDSRPALSPSYPGLSLAHQQSDRSPGQSFPSPVSSGVSPSSIQPPNHLLGARWVVSKPRVRLSMVLTAEQQKAFYRIGAIVRGFLTRRLLKTEKVRHLRQNVMDTQEFICSFQTEATDKRGSLSAQDRSLQERVRAQLRAALFDIHNIFFEMPLGDRLSLLQQERELQADRKLRDMEKAKCPKERVVLSAATQRSLDRKKMVSDCPAQAQKMQQKPKSPTTNRVIKQNPVQNPPLLNRQGSWYRRTPEERVRRSDSLKKQHSLG